MTNVGIILKNAELVNMFCKFSFIFFPDFPVPQESHPSAPFTYASKRSETDVPLSGKKKPEV